MSSDGRDPGAGAGPRKKQRGRPFPKGAANPGRATQFKPGVSPNPGGRKRTPDVFFDFLSEVPVGADGRPILDANGNPMDRLQLAYLATWKAAVDHNHKDQIRAQELLYAYRHGKPREHIEVELQALQAAPPKEPEEFKARYREIGGMLLRKFVLMLERGMAVPETDMKVLQFVSDQLGLVGAAKLADLEVAKSRLLLDALSKDELSDEHRSALVRAMRGEKPADRSGAIDVQVKPEPEK